MLTEKQITELKGRITSVRSQVAEAAKNVGREPSEITLVGVSKFFPADYALNACQNGLIDLGENRVQEMLEKYDYLQDHNVVPRWHLIGTLQKNKVKYIIGKTHLIHSIDSRSLLEEISKRSSKADVMTDVLLQVNISGETSKHGFSSAEIISSIDELLLLPGVRLRGLMTMAPLTDNPDNTLPVFDSARELLVTLQKSASTDVFNILSMGMSQDYRQAISCGATHVRIGTAIFGPRNF